jgi:hypothetical protein
MPPRDHTPPGESDASKRVADFLAQYIAKGRKVTAREVAAATGVKEGTVRGLPPWKKYRAYITAKQRPSTGAILPTRPFAEGAEPLIPGRADDPAKLAEIREVESLANWIRTDPDYRDFVEREFIEDDTIDPSRKAEYHKLRLDEKTQFLITWKAYGLVD